MKKFDEAFSRTIESAGISGLDEQFDPAIQILISEYGGASYAGGFYRVFDFADALRWTATIREFFPSHAENVEAFSRDWQGNVFGYRGGQAPCVLLFQPGTGDVFEVADSIESFHNEELVEHAEEALSLSLWNEWRTDSPAPAERQCVAYIQPVFLGGDVDVDNLAMADLDVYWEVAGQLLEQIRDLPEGTPIAKVSLDYLT